MIDVVCLHCKRQFTYEKSGRGRLRRYCSTQCKSQASDPYYNLNPEERAERNRRRGMKLTCAQCSKPMFRGTTSRPQGLALCRPCRNLNNPKPERNPGPPQWTCETCSAHVVGTYGKPGKFCAPCADLRKRNRDNTRGFRKRARRFGVHYQPVTPATIFKRDRWRCGLCHKKVDQRLSYPHPMSASLDHIIPMSLGGDHVPANLTCSHLSCNLLKSNRGSGEQLALIG